MKRYIFIGILLIASQIKAQSFYKSGNLIGDGWISSDSIHILSSNQTPSTGYSENNMSPIASAGNNVRLNNCTPITTNYNLTSSVISSLGYTNIRIGFGRRKSSIQAPVVILEFFNGTSWENISSDVRPSNDDTWSSIFFDLPSSANNNPTLQFRFSYSTSVNTGCVAAANFRVDDFWVGANHKLPIQLAAFDLSHLNGKPKIKWSTYAENNNDYFTIQRSKDGIKFDALAQVKGNGTSDKLNEYSYIDQYPLPGNIYYRVKQTDLDGSYTYTPIKSISIESNQFLVYPTLVTSELNISVPVNMSTNGTWTIYSFQGTKIIDGNPNNALHFVIPVFQIPPGQYILRYQSAKDYKVVKWVKM